MARRCVAPTTFVERKQDIPTYDPGCLLAMELAVHERYITTDRGS